MNLPWRPQYINEPIETSLTQRETAKLRELARGKRMLEIGSAYGYSTIAMAQVADSVMTVDHHRDRSSLDILFTNLAEYGVEARVHLRQGDCQTILPQLGAYHVSFDLVFVDGDHLEHGVRFDALWADRLCKPGGMIAFHDYGEDSCSDVRRVLDELYPSGPVELVDTLFIVRASEKKP